MAGDMLTITEIYGPGGFHVWAKRERDKVIARETLLIVENTMKVNLASLEQKAAAINRIDKLSGATAYERGQAAMCESVACDYRITIELLKNGIEKVSALLGS